MIVRSLAFLVREEVRAFWTALAIVFYLVMLVWSAIPGQHEQIAGHANDKLLHFAAYACIAFALYLGQAGNPRRAMRVIGLVAVLGGIDETLQWVEPHRTADVTDWAVDTLAAVTVVATMRRGHRFVAHAAAGGRRAAGRSQTTCRSNACK